MYIIRKFPQLEEYVLETDETADENTPFHSLNQRTLTHLLRYLQKVKTIDVRGLVVDGNAIAGAFKDVWEETVSVGSQEVHIYYTDHTNVRNLHISKTKQYNYAQLYFRSGGWYDFLQKNGKFLKKLDISVERLDDFFEFLPNDIIQYIARYCPNLKSLNFEDASFEDYSRSTTTKLNQTLSLDELCFESCTVSADIMKQFSQVILEVKTLSLGVFFESDYEINMPHTKIDLIIIKTFGGNGNYIKLLVSSENKYYYSQLDLKKQPAKIEDSNEKEYENATQDQRVYICCQTMPNFAIVSNSYYQ